MKTKTRIEVLEKWLERVDARALMETTAQNKRLVITAYAVPGVHRDHVGRTYLMIVQRSRLTERGPFNSFEVFVPAAPGSNEIAATLDGAALALGIDGCAGLLNE